MIRGCSKCGKRKRWTAQQFCRDRSKRGGLSTTCRDCNKKRLYERYHSDLPASRALGRQRYHEDYQRRAQTKHRANAYYRKHAKKVRARIKAREKARQKAGLPRIIDPIKRELAKARVRLRCHTRYWADVEASRSRERARIRTAADLQRKRLWAKNNPGRVLASIFKRRGLIGASATHFTKNDLARMRTMQKGLCLYCTRRMTGNGRLREVIDHKTPVSKGGSNGPENIALACWECNSAKGKQTAEAFLTRSDRPGKKPTKKPATRAQRTQKI